VEARLPGRRFRDGQGQRAGGFSFEERNDRWRLLQWWVKRLLVPFTDVSDAWLGLTCNQLERPDINDCYCSGCTKAMLAEKQGAWAWLGGASSTFGWINGNPNGGFRCAALAYNPDTTIWGWVDRPCDKTSFSHSAGYMHGYRTICELEP